MKRSLCKNKRQLWLIPLSIITLGGFSKITEWGKENFKQTAQHAKPFVDKALPFVKMIKIRSQFSILATFDVMLLTDEMRMLYVDFYKKDHGLTKTQELSLRQRQLNENKYFISMYVVATQSDRIYVNNRALFTGEHQKTGVILGMKDANWNVRMIIGGREYWPESIRVVDLPMEYRQCFGIAGSQFATTYLVRFAASDDSGRPILLPHQKSSIILQFTSSLYQIDAVWKHVTYYM